MKKILSLFLLFLFIFFGKESKAQSFGVGKIVNHQRPMLPYKKLIEQNKGYYIGPDEKSVFLTFDCGYENGYTSSILDTLKENDTKAAFFITGHYLNTNSDLVKRMKDEGHIIGNHTYHHNHFTKESSTSMLNDINKLEQLYFEKYNCELSSFVRPPAGEFTEESLNVLKNNNYTTVFWSLAYVDWYKDKYNGNEYSYRNVMNKIHNGAIILMHTVSKDNMMDLDKIIKDLKNTGYKFNTLYDL